MAEGNKGSRRQDTHAEAGPSSAGVRCSFEYGLGIKTDENKMALGISQFLFLRRNLKWVLVFPARPRLTTSSTRWR